MNRTTELKKIISRLENRVKDNMEIISKRIQNVDIYETNSIKSYLDEATICKLSSERLVKFVPQIENDQELNQIIKSHETMLSQIAQSSFETSSSLVRDLKFNSKVLEILKDMRNIESSSKEDRVEEIRAELSRKGYIYSNEYETLSFFRSNDTEDSEPILPTDMPQEIQDLYLELDELLNS